jgi:hypothetical protein
MVMTPKGHVIRGIFNTHLGPFDGKPVQYFKFPSLLLACVLATGCSFPTPGEASEDAISRESFINAYVELRVAALQAPGREVTVQLRDGVLDGMELQESDLLDFVEVHGKDVQYMRRLWEEVDSIFRDRRNPPEPGGTRGPS